MKINDTFSVERDKYQWILTETHETVGKGKKNKGKVVLQKKNTYHSNLGQVARHILNITAINCESLERMEDVWNGIANDIESTLNKMVKA